MKRYGANKFSPFLIGKEMKKETIAAISTPLGKGGVGIIRISGDSSFDIAERIFSGKKSVYNMDTHKVSYGKILGEDNEVLDEVLLLKMKSPNTFTGEDVIEINCHGGVEVLRRVLRRVYDVGAIPAEPGEFTKRAFLNGKMDLVQAEAVIEVINSTSERSAKEAMKQLEGFLSDDIKKERKKLVEVVAHLEAEADYPEHQIEEITREKIENTLFEVKNKISKISESFEKGQYIKNGIKVVIVGSPNVGKSSLLNALVGKERAIVAEVPGTTRDVIEESYNINGISVMFTDTAGIRTTSDEIEKIGVERSIKELDSGDIFLVVVDISEGIDKEIVEKVRDAKDLPIIFVFNKMDLITPDDFTEKKNIILDEIRREIGDKNISAIDVSAKNREGIEKVVEEIEKNILSDKIYSKEESLLTNERHKILVDKSLDSIEKAKETIEMRLPPDLCILDIRDAIEYLGKITGEDVDEDILHEVFSKFCIGK